jgi:hypothetical protein
LKTLYEEQNPRNPKVQIEFIPHAVEYRCFGMSCSVPRPGDRIQPVGGPQFEIVKADPYGDGFQGTCKLV